MPKKRMISPEAWTDDKFVSVSPLARLLFIGMWNFACDNGHLDNSNLQIKMRVLPADNCDVETLIQELLAADMIERTEEWVKVTNLSTHQRPDLRFLVFCDHCEHDEHTMYDPTDKKPRPKSARGAHDERPKSARRNGGVGVDGGVDVVVDSAGKPAPRATKLPNSWTPTDEHRDRAKSSGLNLDQESVKFRAHAEEKGRTAKSWNAAFTRWLINAAEYAQRDGRPSSNGQQSRIDGRGNQQWMYS